LWRDLPDDELRSFVFAALVLTAVALTLVNRSFAASPLASLRRPNSMLAVVLACAGLILLLVLLVPPFAVLFRFGPLRAAELLLAVVAALGVLLLLEALKPIFAALMRGRAG
jgi:Ca2+-transporting ATPase